MAKIISIIQEEMENLVAALPDALSDACHRASDAGMCTRVWPRRLTVSFNA